MTLNMERYLDSYSEINHCLLAMESCNVGQKPFNHPPLRAELLRLAELLEEPEAARFRALAEHYVAPPKKIRSWLHPFGGTNR